MRYRKGPSSVVLLALLLIASPASAQPESPAPGEEKPSAPSPAASTSAPAPNSALNADTALTDQARELHLKGVALFREGSYQRARAAFLAAYRVKRHWQIAGALGACELRLGLSRDAAQHLKFFLDGFPATGDRQERRQTEGLFNQARAAVGLLHITMSDDEAVLTIDGEPVPPEDRNALFVTPGRHVLQAELPGRPLARSIVEIIAGAEQTLNLEVPASRSSVGPSAPAQRPGISVWWPIGTGALSVSGLAIGTIGAIAAGSAASDLATHRATLGGQACVAPPANLAATCQERDSAADAEDAFTNLAVAGFATGGVFAFATVGMLLFEDLQVGEKAAQDAAQLKLLPLMGPRTSGLLLRGVW